MLALTPEENQLILGLVAILIGVPGGTKVVTWFRRILSIEERVSKLEAITGHPAYIGQDGADQNATGFHRTILEHRDLIDILADEIACREDLIYAGYEASDLAMFAMDEEGKVVWMSQAFGRLVGYGQDEAMDRWRESIGASDRSKVLADWERFLPSNRKTIVLKYVTTSGTKHRMKLVRVGLARGTRVMGYVTTDNTGTTNE